MTTNFEVLARHVIACKGWRWLPGMRAIGKYPNNPVRIHEFGENVQDLDDMENSNIFLRWQQPVIHGDQGYDGPYIPDLTDPATLGCLLQLVREAHSDQCACVFPIDYGPAGVMWQVRLAANGRQLTDRHYTTETEALVAALEGTS